MKTSPIFGWPIAEGPDPAKQFPGIVDEPRTLAIETTIGDLQPYGGAVSASNVALAAGTALKPTWTSGGAALTNLRPMTWTSTGITPPAAGAYIAQYTIATSPGGGPAVSTVQCQIVVNGAASASLSTVVKGTVLAQSFRTAYLRDIPAGATVGAQFTAEVAFTAATLALQLIGPIR